MFRCDNFCCPICDEELKNFSNLGKHIKLKHTCHQCNKLYEKCKCKTFKCSIGECVVEFQSRSVLFDHIKFDHLCGACKGSQSACKCTTKLSAPLDYPCHVAACNQRYTSEDDLVCHLMCDHEDSDWNTNSTETGKLLLT